MHAIQGVDGVTWPRMLRLREPPGGARGCGKAVDSAPEPSGRTMQVGRAGSDPLPFCEQCGLLMRPEAAFGEAEVVPRDDAPFVFPPSGRE